MPELPAWLPVEVAGAASWLTTEVAAVAVCVTAAAASPAAEVTGEAWLTVDAAGDAAGETVPETAGETLAGARPAVELTAELAGVLTPDTTPLTVLVTVPSRPPDDPGDDDAWAAGATGAPRPAVAAWALEPDISQKTAINPRQQPASTKPRSANRPTLFRPADAHASGTAYSTPVCPP